MESLTFSQWPIKGTDRIPTHIKIQTTESGLEFTRPGDKFQISLKYTRDVNDRFIKDILDFASGVMAKASSSDQSYFVFTEQNTMTLSFEPDSYGGYFLLELCQDVKRLCVFLSMEDLEKLKALLN